MSKIICDICGTSYPETAAQCPICGCVRPGDVQRVTSEVKKDGNVSTGYTYVKGGRFSKSNVKKRNQSSGYASQASAVSLNSKETPHSKQGNRGLVITAVVLLLAIIAIVIYIALRFFGPISWPGGNQDELPDSTPSNTSTSPSEKEDLSCTALKIDSESILFEQAGEAKLLSVTPEPKNTSDRITFTSSDESVVTVNADGKVTAVGKGSAVITVTCGNIQTQCTVECQFEEETSGETTEETVDNTTEPTTPPQVDFRLNRKDITFSTKGDSWVLYSGSIAKNLVTWGSNNEEIATFVDGKVVAVGRGTTEVYAEYNGQKVSCIIRCNFQESAGVGGNGGGVSEDGGDVSDPVDTSEPTEPSSGTNEDGGNAGSAASGSCKIYSHYGDVVSDITIRVGESVGLTLKDAAGNPINISWTVSGSGCTLSGNKITGVEAGNTATVSTTYNGITYSCTVHVRTGN